MSNSTQNDEIGKMERAINEGFAESEKFLKGMKTPFDKSSTQNNDPIINGTWGIYQRPQHWMEKVWITRIVFKLYHRVRNWIITL